MADRFYSVILGEHVPSTVTEGAASTAGDAVELRVTFDATGMDKQRALIGVDAIKMYILQDHWPPNT